MSRRLLPLFLLALLAVPASEARAAAEVRRLSLVLSAAPTEIKGGDFNEDIDFINRILDGNGLEGLDNVTYGWLFGAELRYFLTSDWVVTAGVGQLKQQSAREYLPALQQQIQIRQEILSVPIHAGASYYFEPYNQGDFQARAFLGGGLLSLATNRVTSQQSSTLPQVPNAIARWNGTGTGFYVEGGVHMFFAARFSVILNALYREARTSNMVYTVGDPSIVNAPAYNAHRGTEYELDSGGIGFRMGLAIGL